VVASKQQQPQRATRLLAAADALREALEYPLRASGKREHDQAIASSLSALGDAAFEASWNEGRSLSMDDAVAYALEDVTKYVKLPRRERRRDS
jgi:hypothetical protein